MNSVGHLLTHYGYLAIFALLMLGIVGPLIPDETILVISGILIHKGQLHLAPAAAAGVAGSICGITVSWMIGFYGFGWLDRRWPWLHRFAEEHMALAERWFRRFGRWTLFFGYFVAGVRHVTALFAGISSMPYRRFAGYAYAGAVCWVFTFLGIGYFAGEGWSRIGGTVNRAVAVAALVTIAAAAYLFIRHQRAQTKAGGQP